MGSDGFPGSRRAIEVDNELLGISMSLGEAHFSKDLLKIFFQVHSTVNKYSDIKIFTNLKLLEIIEF